MANSNCSDDLEIFEDLFKDRFTEKDSAYNEIKSKALPPPTVIFPWRVKKEWNKQWDFTRQRRDGNRSRYNDHHRSNSYRDRSQDGEGSRDRHRDDRETSGRNRDDRNWKRDGDQHHRRNHHDRE